MKILVSSINFAPDHAGIGVYSTDFPVYLSEQGHDVTMVTGFPYYPQWRKHKSDRGRLFAKENYRGVKTLRGYLYVPERVSAVRRLIHEATFCLFAAVNFLRAGRPDVIVIFSPPFLLGLVAHLAAKLWRRSLVINIQDLPLDAAMALGMVKPSIATRLMLACERWIYRNADQVVSISSGMLEKVWAKGVAKEKTLLVPNWVKVAEYSVSRRKGGFLRQHPQAIGKVTVAYAGNLGVKQGVDMLIRMAEAVGNDTRFHFFVIGEGADKPRLKAMVDELKLNNLTFLPFLPPEPYKEMLADVDLLFVAQRKGAGNNFFPSKLLGLMASQKALLVAADADSELARTIESGGFGMVSQYGDTSALVQNLYRYADGSVSIEETGKKGLTMSKRFDRSVVLGEWEDRIKALVASAPAREFTSKMR